jgi:hypothetical protein
VLYGRDGQQSSTADTTRLDAALAALPGLAP